MGDSTPNFKGACENSAAANLIHPDSIRFQTARKQSHEVEELDRSKIVQMAASGEISALVATSLVDEE